MIQMGEIVPLGNSRPLKFGHSMDIILKFGHSRNIILIFGHSGNRTLQFIVFPSGSDHRWLNYFHNVAWNIVNAIIFLWPFPAQWTSLVHHIYFDILFCRFNNNPWKIAVLVFDDNPVIDICFYMQSLFINLKLWLSRARQS